MPQYSTGQKVNYKPVGGMDGKQHFAGPSKIDNTSISGPDSNTSSSVGVIQSVLTEPGVQADRNVNASPDAPRYEIENSNTGKTSTIYEANILGKAS
ncbi:Fc.00g000960.m01.CDS01 [Cosmosporella sp. VM-42]